MYKAILGAICYLSFALSLHAQSPQEKGLQGISRTSAEAIVSFLADDELQGREAGMHGSRIAARYLASCLKEAGIAPLEKDSYYQPFEAYNKERQQRGRWQVHPDSIAILKRGVHRSLQMNNVLGTIPGERPDEYVIVGAHFDHLGTDETLTNDRIYNGADDNASGVSAVLQIARAFLTTGQKPLRTVIFAFWDGEENGSPVAVAGYSVLGTIPQGEVTTLPLPCATSPLSGITQTAIPTTTSLRTTPTG